MSSNGISYPLLCPKNTTSVTQHGQNSSQQPAPSTHGHSHRHHPRQNSLSSRSSSHHGGSSDNLSGYASSFESASSFPDDFLPCSAFSEQKIEIFHESCRCEVVIDENLRASDLCHLLTLKLNLSRSLTWNLVLEIPTLNLQRIFENDEEVLPQYVQFEKSKIRLSIKSSLRW